MPFDVVSIDTIGPFILSENGNRYAVTLQCDLSKYVIAIPIPDKSAKTIAKAVLEKCILIFGAMKSIKTDQGTEYKGVFEEICKLLHIKHKRSTPYHPQTIGALERNHKVLNEYLRIFSNARKDDWDQWLPFYCFAYNTTPNLQHNYTPFELVFGRRNETFEMCKNKKVDPIYNVEAYEKELKHRLQVAHQNVMNTLSKEKGIRTETLNKNTIPSKLTIGVDDSAA